MWAEQSGLYFTFKGGPVTAKDVNILIIHDPIREHDDKTLAITMAPDKTRKPPVSRLRMKDTLPWRPCYTSSGAGMWKDNFNH